MFRPVALLLLYTFSHYPLTSLSDHYGAPSGPLLSKQRRVSEETMVICFRCTVLRIHTHTFHPLSKQPNTQNGYQRLFHGLLQEHEVQQCGPIHLGPFLGFPLPLRSPVLVQAQQGIACLRDRSPEPWF
ncbi:hypothetical protein BC939DRAFT_162492 [Gamsiella multidivaricata]|uniref:uncharacterized protein n=1 Tax=Gamsiella multidivaricata TaxID=101098 RepID=UPI00221EA874|nr:uncharacterized protein BC939DRAFT_162492 [Gamsiella multidivaricata]KAI7823289.1 hypothetical protein BC939DRAFT_162492 [Gamsiella multidivaricata]